MDIVKMNKTFENCSCEREHKCPIDFVEIGSNALNCLPKITKGYNNILIVSDDNTFEVSGKKATEILKNQKIKNLVLNSNGKVVIPNEENIEIIEKAIESDTDLIIGVGSGVINDLCKYVSFFNNLPYYIVATAPSMDGYASVGAAMILKGMKVTVNARPPKAIIADSKVLKDAPLEMLKAGYGDIVGKFSCLNDWKLSAIVNDEYFCQKVYDYTLNCAENIKHKAENILLRDEKTVTELMDALVIVGVLMAYVNSSRPASGSEHHLSHFFEITGIIENKEYFAHGIDVLYSTYYTQKLREELLLLNEPNYTAQISNADYEAEIQRIYHSLADEVIKLQDKMGWYKTDKFEIYKQKWQAIKNVLSESPSSSDIKNYIENIGLNLKEFEDLYGDKKITDALFFAKDLKDRYSVLWLYFRLKYTK